MEAILAVYSRAYDENRPVLCYDERPCFLIGNSVKGLEMQQGQPKRENYSYTKHGSCCLLAAIEPLTGRRIAKVEKRRRKREFAHFLKQISQAYPEAEKITVVLDNLNTHNASSFYETFEAQEAAELMDRFEFVYTPKNASWLNMIEIEFSALSRQCLNRRIACQDELAKEVEKFFKDREEKQIKINWQFTRETARERLGGRYKQVNSLNQKT